MCMCVCIHACVCNFPLASVTKIQLVHISCLTQHSGACSIHTGAEFVRETVGEPCCRWEGVDINLDLVQCENVD